MYDFSRRKFLKQSIILGSTSALLLHPSLWSQKNNTEVAGMEWFSADVFTESLYGHRLLFRKDGTPLIPVGLSQSLRELKITALAEGILYRHANDAGVKIQRNDELIFTCLQSTAATVVEEFYIATLLGSERKKAASIQEQWAMKNMHTSLLALGGTYGMHDAMVDNRATLLVSSQSQEQLLAGGARPVPHKRVTILPKMRIHVEHQGRSLGECASLRMDGIQSENFSFEWHRANLPTHMTNVKKVRQQKKAKAIYRGGVMIAPDAQGLMALVNTVDVDALIGGILPSEMFSTAPLEALKAQAIAARCEVYAKIGRRHLADPFCICTQQHCQVYAGKSAEKNSTNKAAQQTSGKLLVKNEILVDTVYSACCGGHTEAADAVWDRPYDETLQGGLDVEHLSLTTSSSEIVPNKVTIETILALPREKTFCGRSSMNQKGDVYRWVRTMDGVQLTELFKDDRMGEITDIRIDSRGPGGRVRQITVMGTQSSTVILRELPIRQKFQNLRSGLFTVALEKNSRGIVERCTFRGGGYGHGSGMCQQGAIGMAEAGYKAENILAHYYKGSQVVSIHKRA